MNSAIETLNQFGSRSLHFAWPMLWQSSLLIVVVFALDLLLARKIRTSVRYALWLVVLVKLLLPPTLALPSGPAWWLFHAQPPTKEPAFNHYVVTYDASAPAMNFVPSAVLPPPPPPLSGAGWTLVVSVTVSVGLLLWLIVRWWQVARMVRRAKSLEAHSDVLASARVLAKRRFAVRLKTVEGRMSPAVCGWFRPVILLPRELVETLSPGQFRAVLLHELFHLRRGDVWVNCAQALLQIVYWWHPLLWLANARIRRLREEAVDDAVMLALRDEADNYAPTLLEVAKLTFRRPLLSLGLVGIMESRSALRQRIERLVDFRAPRKAGLTFASLCGIFVFSAVALPMGEAPGSADESNLPATPVSITSRSWTPTNTPAVLVQAEIYRMRQADWERLIADPAFAATRQNKVENFKQFERLLKSSGFYPISRPRIQTASGIPAEFYVGNETNSIEFECRPVVTNAAIDLASRIKIISTMENVTTTNELKNEAVLESGGGHVFSIKSQENLSGSNIVVVTVGAEIVTNPAHFRQRLQTIIQRRTDAEDVATNLITRTFRVDTRNFMASLKQFGVTLGDRTNSPAKVSTAVRQFLASLGVNWDSPGGKALFFNDQNGILFVRATRPDLDTVEQAVEALNYTAPQIHVKARFLEVPRGALELLRPFPQLTNGVNVLSDVAAQELLHELASTPQTKILAEPECTTISGRQTQMRATQIVTVVTNVVFERNPGDGASSEVFESNKIETGPVLDVVPNVLSDGYTINLTVIPSLTKFWGYNTPPTNDVEHINNDEIHPPAVLPDITVRQIARTLNLWDGQTVILSGLPEKNYVNGKETNEKPKTKDKELLVFITATIVDPAGNRIHSDDELPFAQRGVPPQPPQPGGK